MLAFLDNGNILLTHQYRVLGRGWIYDMPGGIIEPGESEESAAIRELEEETGYRAATIDHLIDFFTTPGGNNEMIRIYLARNLEFVGRPDEQEGEERELQVEWIDFEEALSSVLASQIKSPSATVGILAAAQILKR